MIKPRTTDARVRHRLDRALVVALATVYFIGGLGVAIGAWGPPA